MFQTKTVASQNFAQIYQTYVSDTPIPKNSKIVIEMWDYDRFTCDDLMSSWTLNPEKHFGGGGTTLYDNRHKDGKHENLIFWELMNLIEKKNLILIYGFVS